MRLKPSFFLLQLRFALFIHPSMGLFSSPAKVYKPAAEVDLGPGSDEHYISPNVRGQSCVLRFSSDFRVCLAFRAIQALELEVIRSGDPYASSDE